MKSQNLGVFLIANSGTDFYISVVKIYICKRLVCFRIVWARNGGDACRRLEEGEVGGCDKKSECQPVNGADFADWPVWRQVTAGAELLSADSRCRTCFWMDEFLRNLVPN